MIPAVEAEALILDLTPYPQGEHCIEQISLTEAQGRILAQPVSSDLDFPHWDKLRHGRLRGTLRRCTAGYGRASCIP